MKNVRFIRPRRTTLYQANKKMFVLNAKMFALFAYLFAGCSREQCEHTPIRRVRMFASPHPGNMFLLAGFIEARHKVVMESKNAAA